MADPVIVSVFVNPKQFAPGEDYARYPRTLDADREALEKLGVDILFSPSPEEMYPPGFSTTVAVEGLGDRLEGRVRPGHFRGVATVVLKLLEIAVPRFAYFGRKDAQQAQVIRRMARDLSLDPEIVVCPIVREPDGLAMSSRNAYLSAGERRAATVLYRALETTQKAIAAGEFGIRRAGGGGAPRARHRTARESRLCRNRRRGNFEALPRLRGHCLMVLAVRIGATRLIDNLLIEIEQAG